MKMEKLLGSALMIGLLLIGCATERSVTRESEKLTAQVDSSENYGALLERLRTLEQSISDLRSEVADLGNRLRNIHARPPTHRL